MRASVTLFRNLQHLGNYCILNYTGFVKICKKHDKSVAAELRLWAPHLEAELETLAFVTQSGLGTLLRQLEAAHANPNPNPNPHPNPSPNLSFTLSLSRWRAGCSSSSPSTRCSSWRSSRWTRPPSGSTTPRRGGRSSEQE